MAKVEVTEAEIKQLKERLLQLSEEIGGFSQKEQRLYLKESILARYLSKNKNDINAAYEMCHKNFTWRREFQGIGVEKIKEESILNELRIGKSFPHEYDKAGRPIIYCRPRLHFGSQCDREELHRWSVWGMDHIMTEMMPPHIDECTMIYDLAGFGLSNMDYDFVKEIISLFDYRYPGSLHQVFILNSPWLFYGCWALIKPYIAPEFVERIKFVYQEDLKNHIDESKLLAEVGGSNPYEYSHESPVDRSQSGFIPYWEMDWVYKRTPDGNTTTPAENTENTENKE